jgi:hypothetical protein
MSMVGQVTALWPKDTRHDVVSAPFVDIAINGIRVTGSIGPFISGCTNPVPIVGVIHCKRHTDYEGYRALTSVTFTISGQSASRLQSTYATAATPTTMTETVPGSPFGTSFPFVWNSMESVP